MSEQEGGHWRKVIQTETDLGALLRMRESEQSRLSEALQTSSAAVVAEALNKFHDALILRALKLAEKEMARRGLGTPPVPYAYMLFGSGGRSEQTFSSDQDSGIVYANPSSEEAREACRAFFPKMADAAVQNLIQLGYPPCEGNVVASNPDWCLSLTEWHAKIDAWFEDPTWEHVRYLLIVADGRAVAGDYKLAYMLKNRFLTDIRQTPLIVRRMMDNMLRFKSLVGLFGQLLPERYGENAGSLDIKYGPYLLTVNVFRLLAIQAGIRETSTLGRIKALCEAGFITLQDAERAVSAFTLFLNLRLMSRDKVPKEQLTKEIVSKLKKADKTARDMQRRIQHEMDDRLKGR
jgi:CBS domain-containing protein